MKEDEDNGDNEDGIQGKRDDTMSIHHHFVLLFTVAATNRVTVLRRRLQIFEGWSIRLLLGYK